MLFGSYRVIHKAWCSTTPIPRYPCQARCYDPAVDAAHLSQRRCFAALVLFFFATPILNQEIQAPPPAALSAREVAVRLAAVGPRSAAEPRRRAAGFLLDALRRAGLERVRAVPHDRLVNVEGVLPGEVADEIVLSAHYDSVAWSPGAGDDASGCGVAVAAAAELRRTPLRHTVRVVLFDGEEAGLLGSKGWLEDLGADAGRRILADLNLEMLGWSRSAGPVILSFPGRTAAGRGQSPGWLVHAILQSGKAVEWPYAVADSHFPLRAQLVMRSWALAYGSDSESFLERGIPSVTLSDSSLREADPACHRSSDAAGRLDARRLERWTEAVAAAVRRLDTLAGRPLPEDQYLVVRGRVWLRRDLMWIAFLLWAALVLRSRRGRWRGGSAAERRRQMRAYLPGFLFRLLLLLAVSFAPVFSVLLLPAAALALFPPRNVWMRSLWIVLGFLPLLSFLHALLIAFAGEIILPQGGFQAGPAAGALIPATLLAYALTIARGPFAAGRAPELTGDDPPGKVES